MIQIDGLYSTYQAYIDDLYPVEQNDLYDRRIELLVQIYAADRYYLRNKLKNLLSQKDYNELSFLLKTLDEITLYNISMMIHYWKNF
jgi:hypothetical protein